MQFYAFNTSYTFVILFFSFPEPAKQIFYCKVYYSIIITNYGERVKFSFVKYPKKVRTAGLTIAGTGRIINRLHKNDIFREICDG